MYQEEKVQKNQKQRMTKIRDIRVKIQQLQQHANYEIKLIDKSKKDKIRALEIEQSNKTEHLEQTYKCIEE